ncbi:MAG: NAD(P)H-hydrate dehydratase [Abditibacteriales bacterium]|nr:NAD(P)H-hydrate dehydratase [Abditibacteriales bacterium]
MAQKTTDHKDVWSVVSGQESVKLTLTSEIRQIDQTAIEQLGMSGMMLMESAGLRVVESIEAKMGDLRGKRVVIVCGKGNNGGDGFAIARHLSIAGAAVRVFLAASKQDVSGDALAHLRFAEATNVPVTEVVNEGMIGAVEPAIASAHLVVDAMLGTGVSGAPRGMVAKIIPLLNRADAPVVAVDVPSGLNADTGEVAGACVQATWTVTLGLPKRGLLLYPGAAYAGEVYVGDLGIPPALLNGEHLRTNVTTPDIVRAWLPPRKPTAHKGDCGRVLVVGGSAGMLGAALLAGRAALRGGAGLVTLALPQGLNQAAKAALLEATTLPLSETPNQTVDPAALHQIQSLLHRFNALAIGPGISREDGAAAFVRSVVASSVVPTVIDADGILAFAGERREELQKANAPLVLTPHPGEMAALLATRIEEVERDRIATAQQAANECHAVVVLKGARSIVAAPTSPSPLLGKEGQGEVYVNPTGNAGMATGGSGDVLTGLIAALIAQGLDALRAAVVGTYLHGLAGDLAAVEKGQASLIAGDLNEFLPAAFQRVQTLPEERRMTPRLYRLV